MSVYCWKFHFLGQLSIYFGLNAIIHCIMIMPNWTCNFHYRTWDFFLFSKKRGFGKTLICFSKSNTTPKYQYSNGVLFKRGFYPIPVKGSTSPIGLLCKFYIIQVIFFQNISLFIQLPITFYTKTLAMLNLEHYFFHQIKTG